MTEPQHKEIPLSALSAAPDNVRKTQDRKALEGLVASIRAHGLLTSLVVRPAGKNNYEVVAGQQRLKALQSLAEQGVIKADADIPCTIIGKKDNAAEVSLAENVIRAPMHPADEFEAFAALVDEGLPIMDIAARFGVSDHTVRRRMALARLAPDVLAAFREGEMTLEQVTAFTVSENHDNQKALLEVFATLPSWRRTPEAIREALSENEITAADKRARFVTVEAYENAGGPVRRDLFCNDEKGIFLLDATLLDRLVTEKLEEELEKLRTEGWGWAEARTDLDYADLNDYGREMPEGYEDPSPEAQAVIEKLSRERDALEEKEEDCTDEEEERLDQIDEQIAILEDTAEIWCPTVLKNGGTIVSLNHNGTLNIKRGLIRPEDQKTAKKEKKSAKKKAEETGSNEDTDSETVSLSKALAEALTVEKAGGIAAKLVENHHVTLAAVVHALVGPVIYGQYRAPESALKLIASAGNADKSDMEEAQKSLQDKEGEENQPENFFDWCIKQDTDTLLGLLALAAAFSVQTRYNIDPETADNKLAAALNINMADHFTPTAENYFLPAGKGASWEAIKDVTGVITPAQGKMKKETLAAEAERIVKDTGWLPHPLRLEHAYEAPTTKEETVA